MEQNNISEQENDLQMNEKKDSKKTDEKESTAKTILEYVIRHCHCCRTFD